MEKRYIISKINERDTTYYNPYREYDDFFVRDKWDASTFSSEEECFSIIEALEIYKFQIETIYLKGY